MLFFLYHFLSSSCFTMPLIMMLSSCFLSLLHAISSSCLSLLLLSLFCFFVVSLFRLTLFSLLYLMLFSPLPCRLMSLSIFSCLILPFIMLLPHAVCLRTDTLTFSFLPASIKKSNYLAAVFVINVTPGDIWWPMPWLKVREFLLLIARRRGGIIHSFIFIVWFYFICITIGVGVWVLGCNVSSVR